MNASKNTPPETLDAVVIGAGFAGLYALHRLRGLGLNVHGFEAGTGVGGTWYWNRYPGARTDSASEVYQFWFSDELLRDWNWSERFPAQEETERYLNFVADRLKLRPLISFSNKVTAARWNEAAKAWDITTDKGESVRSRYLLSCLGPLSEPKVPPFKGHEKFKGTFLHTSRWPKGGIDLAGKRVGVIGTGATGVQVIQTIASQVGELYVFQRTPTYAIAMRNPKLTDADRTALRARYGELGERVKFSLTGFAFDMQPKPWAQTTKEERRAVFEQLYADGSLIMWGGNFGEVLVDQAANDELSEFMREKMRARLTKPGAAEKLVPKYGFGTRRPPLDIGYLEAFNRDNVHIVDLLESPIECCTETGIKTGNAEYPLDIIILATGFDAATGAICAIDIRGRDGVELRKLWDRDITTAMGLQKHGFPNFFTSAAPLAPAAAFCNVPTCLQQQVEWISDCIAYVERNGKDKVIEATQAFEDKWVKHHDDVTGATLIAKVDSWWTGANIEGKPRRVLSYIHVGNYRKHCEDVASKGYEGFEIR
ncbi:MAG: NAD(P)/FAD-dependent oxidoreductase [Panacagrimonas sp.]|nr:NAD(P)/FAD-dependent oxidoreductase [Panacagrimonas sp.]MCC2657221.1 NAD(P)/FAD-dependent oxidoreductase [Panacagrimonas sp.]